MNESTFTLKEGEYPDWNTFLNAAKAVGLDVDKQFRGTYDDQGNLVGSFNFDRGSGSVTYKDLRTAKERTAFVHDGM